MIITIVLPHVYYARNVYKSRISQASPCDVPTTPDSIFFDVIILYTFLSLHLTPSHLYMYIYIYIMRTYTHYAAYRHRFSAVV